MKSYEVRLRDLRAWRHVYCAVYVEYEDPSSTRAQGTNDAPWWRVSPRYQLLGLVEISEEGLVQVVTLICDYVDGRLGL